MDIFTRTKAQFDLPENIIYLDGNSLGPLLKASKDRLSNEINEQWGGKLIAGWNESGWYDLPSVVGDKISRLIGAPKGSVMCADSTSINVYKLLSAALKLNPERKIILSDSGNFPTDLYVAQGLIKQLGQGHELKIVAPEEIENAFDEEVAVSLITQVDYRSGRLHDMQKITQKAHEVGALTLWDLCHSAGALPIDLKQCKADFAVGCGYKYLNGGPGAPAFLYVRPDLINDIEHGLCGWMGHSSPFAFDESFTPFEGIERMRVGTAPILGMSSLDAALSVWDKVDMAQLRARSIELSEMFIQRVEASCELLVLASPRNPQQRGSQVSFYFDEAYACIQALISKGVVGDFRMPNVMRFGFTPLYLSFDEVERAADMLIQVINDRLWDTETFKQRRAVT
jgi:kynureninase